MGNSSTSALLAGNAAPSKLLYWALIAAVAFPVRLEVSIGPFATLSVLDLVLVGCCAYFAFWLAAFMPMKAGPPSLAFAVLTPAVLALASVLWTADPARTTATSLKYAHSAITYFVALQFGAGLVNAALARSAIVILAGWLAGSAAMYLRLPGFAFFSASGGFSETELLEVFASLYTRLGHPYVGQSNDYAPVLALLAFILLGCGLVMKNRSVLLASGIAFAAVMLTFSRGLVAAAFLALVAWAFMVRPKFRQMAWFFAPLIAAAAVIGAIAASEVSVNLAHRELEVADVVASRLSAENIDARLQGYSELFEFVSNRPWLGYGAGYYDKSHPDGLVSAHNALFEQWKYFGLVLGTLSFACYIMIMLYFFRLHRRLGRAALTDALACAWLCLIVSSMAETFFEATTPRAVIYFMLGLCVSAAPREILHGRADPACAFR